MTRLTDNTKTVEITMTNWTGSGYTPDWSNDFFSVSSLTYNDVLDAYIVPDVDYCISTAEDWGNGRWDGDDEADPEEIENRCVTIDIL